MGTAATREWGEFKRGKALEAFEDFGHLEC
jgi:hypothetical protein